MQYKIANTYIRTPATQSDLDDAKRRLTYIPKVLQQFWSITNGVGNFYEQEVFSVQAMLSKNELLGVKLRDPLYLLVGIDREKGIFIHTSDHGDQLKQTVYALKPNYLGSLKPERVADSLYEWVNINFGSAEEG